MAYVFLEVHCCGSKFACSDIIMELERCFCVGNHIMFLFLIFI